MNRRLWILFVGFTIIFWILRLSYWSITNEVPFSDIGDYVRIGQTVASAFDFRFDDFWASYKPPGVPLFLGLIFKFFGSDDLAWVRIFQTGILFVSALWMGFELYVRKTPYFILVLLGLAIALSKPSIFWSYKPSTESLSEAFMYLNIACGLYFFRKSSILSALFFGFCLLMSVLIRPQALLVLPMAGIAILLQKQSPRKIQFKYLALVAISAFLTWLPWGARNYQKYGHFLFLSTQGPYSFLWELGNVEVKIPGIPDRTIVKSVYDLQKEAPLLFKNDFEAMNYASFFMKDWIFNNWKDFPFLIFRRLIQSSTDHAEYLTKVSRIDLFQSDLNKLLIDKSWWGIIFGVLGLIFFSFTLNINWLWVLAIPIAQWFMGILFLGYARILDPSLPIILFGNSYWLYFLYHKIRTLNGRIQWDQIH